jgi:hypothetical protein
MKMPFGFEPSGYGPVTAGLLAGEQVPPLGPGTPNPTARPQLQTMTVEQLFTHTRVVDRSMAEACFSGLWLYHDCLDESHALSQNIHTPTGSFWHGIMHRREPDFGNAAYWFRRVGQHPIFGDLAAAARELANQTEGLDAASQLRKASHWDPFAFIDLCQTCHTTSGPDHMLCRRVSLAEWQLLFDFSYRRATGA